MRQGLGDLLLLALFRWLIIPLGNACGIARYRLARLAARRRGRQPLVLLGTIDLNFPYWQRMHHLAHELARLDDVLYVTPGKGYDRFLGVGLVSEAIAVTNDFHAAARCFPDAKFLIFSVDEELEERVAFLQERGASIVYDYIDAMHEDVDRKAVSSQRLARHQAILQDESIAVISTARVLHEEVARRRTRNFALITNGVALEHYAPARFRDLDAVSAPFARLLEEGKPLFGFFGSLAVWLDYPLLIKAARLRPDYNWVLIGKRYDGAIARHAKDFPPNLIEHPRVSYAELPRYAAWFDACILPFVINTVTDATSPLKIFEYMALGKPIISTNILEARHYRSPLRAGTPEEFAAQADAALALAHDAAYLALLREEAEQNSWRQKALDVQLLLQSSAPAAAKPRPGA